MLNQIQGIVDQIVAAEKGLETLSEQVDGIERSSLLEALKIASNSLTFQRLTSTASIHNCDLCYHPGQFTFMDKKGVCLATPDDGSQDQDGKAIDEEELWLLDTGAFIITHRKGYKSNQKTASTESTLRLSQLLSFNQLAFLVKLFGWCCRWI